MACASAMIALWSCMSAAVPAPADPAADACPAQAAELAGWLQAIGRLERPSLPNYPEVRWVELPGRPDWPADSRGPLLELRLRRAVLNGDPLPDDLRGRTTQLESVRRRYETLDRLRGRSDPAAVEGRPVLLLAVDADEPWLEVCKLVDAVSQAGFVRIGLLYGHPDPDGPRPPGPSAIDGVLAEIGDSGSGNDRTRRLAEAMRQVLGRCPPLVEAFGRLAWQEPSARAEALAAELPEALGACRCKVDRPSLERLLWHMLYTPPLSMIAAPLAGPDEARALRLEVPGRQPWRQVLPVVLEALGRDPRRPLAFELPTGGG